MRSLKRLHTMDPSCRSSTPCPRDREQVERRWSVAIGSRCCSFSRFFLSRCSSCCRSAGYRRGLEAEPGRAADEFEPVVIDNQGGGNALVGAPALCLGHSELSRPDAARRCWPPPARRGTGPLARGRGPGRQWPPPNRSGRAPAPRRGVRSSRCLRASPSRPEPRAPPSGRAGRAPESPRVERPNSSSAARGSIQRAHAAPWQRADPAGQEHPLAHSSPGSRGSESAWESHGRERDPGPVCTS